MFIQRLYERIAGNQRLQGLESLSPRSQQSLPRNFMLNVFHGGLLRLSAQMSSANLIMPLFVTALGAPAAMIGLIAPLNRMAMLIPQLLIAGYVGRIRFGKWGWNATAVVRARDARRR